MTNRAPKPGDRRDHDTSVATRSVERALASRYSTYLEEVQRLIKAGVRVMQRTGSFDPRVSDVLEEAELSNQAFYRHFRSKDEFLLAVLDDGVRELVGYLRYRMQGAPSATEQIRSWIQGVVAQALNPEAAQATRPFIMPQAHLAERFPEEVASSIRQLTIVLHEAIDKAVEAGDLVDADAERDARVIYDLAMGWLQRTLVDAEPPSAEAANHLVAFAMRGLLRAPGDS
jgi:AcrR family transcriptional regulator